MIIIQIIFSAVVLGVIGFISYWLGVVLHAGPKATQNQISNDPRFQ
ncbi:MAG: hypothetical protein KGJ93_05520 [Patescibacteria group bacterium]|nr:hypothetical protein [Patescibacteria group bacterium]